MKLLFYLFISCPAFSQTDSTQVATTQKAYDLAIEQRDSTVLSALFHPDMIITGGDGSRRNADQEIKDCTDPHYQVVYFRTKNIAVDVFDNTAILRGDIEWQLKNNGNPVVLQRRITFTYTRIKNKWVIVAQHIGMPTRM